MGVVSFAIQTACRHKLVRCLKRVVVPTLRTPCVCVSLLMDSGCVIDAETLAEHLVNMGFAQKEDISAFLRD